MTLKVSWQITHQNQRPFTQLNEKKSFVAIGQIEKQAVHHIEDALGMIDHHHDDDEGSFDASRSKK